MTSKTKAVSSKPAAKSAMKPVAPHAQADADNKNETDAGKSLRQTLWARDYNDLAAEASDLGVTFTEETSKKDLIEMLAAKKIGGALDAPADKSDEPVAVGEGDGSVPSNDGAVKEFVITDEIVPLQVGTFTSTSEHVDADGSMPSFQAELPGVEHTAEEEEAIKAKLEELSAEPLFNVVMDTAQAVAEMREAVVKALAGLNGRVAALEKASADKTAEKKHGGTLHGHIDNLGKIDNLTL